jgi:plasmid stabilization system protein ParE
MAILSNKASRQLNTLIKYYLSKGRLEAAIRLQSAVSEALARADSEHFRTRAFPANYEKLASRGYRWFKVHRYWFAMKATSSGNVIATVFYESANIPACLK